MKKTLEITNQDGTISEYNFFDKAVKPIELLSFFSQAYMNEIKTGEKPPEVVLTKEFAYSVASTEIPNNSTVSNRDRAVTWQS